MKIFYLITKSEAGGAQTHIWQLSRYFIAKGNEVAVMSCPGGWLDDELKKMGVKFYPNTFFSNSLNPVRGFLAMKEIKKALADFKPNLISCHSSAAGFWGRIVIRNKVPTLFTAHGWAFAEGVGWFKKWLAILAEKIAVRYCAKIICVSEYDKRLVLKYRIAPVEKIIAVHNGVEIQEADLEKKDFGGALRIVFVGRFAPQKAQLPFCEVFNLLDRDLKQKIEVLFVGDGPQRKIVERFVQQKSLTGRIKFLGELKRENVFEVLKRAHIFVLISNWEGFPRTVLEAMSCGLPVIASDVGGIKEAVNGDCGILVQRGNKQEIKNALEKLIKNPALSQEMGRNARLRVEQEFSLDKMLQRTAEIYKKLITTTNY